MKSYLYGAWSLLGIIVGYVPSHHLRNCLYSVMGLSKSSTATVYSRCEFRSLRNIRIGSGSIVGERCLLDGRSGLNIGANVNISSGVWIWTLHHDYNSENFAPIGAPVVVHDNTWLCSRATILPGVTIGEGAVVASGAVVTSDVPPYKIVGGVPAKIIGERKENLNYKLGARVPFI